MRITCSTPADFPPPPRKIWQDRTREQARQNFIQQEADFLSAMQELMAGADELEASTFELIEMGRESESRAVLSLLVQTTDKQVVHLRKINEVMRRLIARRAQQTHLSY